MSSSSDWATIAPRRTIVIACRTPQSMARIYNDLTSQFLSDSRIRLVYFLVKGSRFQRGAVSWARRNDVELRSWYSIKRLNPDLVITASPDPSLHEFGCPVVSLPHGAGHNKLRSGIDGVAGVSRDQLKGVGGELPRLIALPGSAALEQLKLDCPEAVEFARVVGDIAFERLRASETHYEEIRHRLGVRPDQHLVMVATTHGPDSMARNHLRFLERLMDRLPDRYRLILVAHPNLDHRDDKALEDILRRQLANGLLMAHPDEWRQAALACDSAIGDLGSTGVYAAALGKPFFHLGRPGAGQMPEHSPLVRLAEVAPVFTPGSEPELELERLLARWEPLDFDFSEILAEPAQGSTRLIAELIYEILGIDPPENAPSVELLSPDLRLRKGCNETRSRYVQARFGDTFSEWSIFPDSGVLERATRQLGHAVVDGDCSDRDLREEAEIVREHGRVWQISEAETHTEKLFEKYVLAEAVSMRIDENKVRVEFRDGWKLIAEAAASALYVLDWVASALFLLLRKLAANPLGLDIPKAIKYLERCFKVRVSLVRA